MDGNKVSNKKQTSKAWLLLCSFIPFIGVTLITMLFYAKEEGCNSRYSFLFYYFTEPPFCVLAILFFIAGWIIFFSLLNRQNKTSREIQIVNQKESNSNADEIKKYKELLDSGLITKEEFEAKKKQLLGL